MHQSLAELQALITQHGDLPVMGTLPDDGTFAVESPRFDSDGAGDECFVI